MTTHNNNNIDLTSTNNYNFPQFDVVLYIPDHHFLSPNPSLNPQGSCFKVLSKEFCILQESLPPSIFVRVSKTRFDLLRATIVVAPGTPYNDGIFIFDIAIPTDYPNEPPEFYYLSHGYDINADLQKDGHVCLSLLNTWFGNKNERWNPKQSTLLQLIRNPPANFEPLIRRHFCDRGNSILAACEAYANGRVKIGFYGCDLSEKMPPRFRIRRRFQGEIEVVYRTLVEEFRRINVDVSVAGKGLVVMENRPVVVQKKEMKKKKKEGIFRRIMGKMKRTFL